MKKVQKVHAFHKIPQRHNWWSHEQLKTAIKMTKEKIPIEEIAEAVGRTVKSCTDKLHKQGYSVTRLT